MYAGWFHCVFSTPAHIGCSPYFTSFHRSVGKPTGSLMGESVISTIGLLVNGIIVADSSADTTHQIIEFKLEATTRAKTQCSED